MMDAMPETVSAANQTKVISTMHQTLSVPWLEGRYDRDSAGDQDQRLMTRRLQSRISNMPPRLNKC